MDAVNAAWADPHFWHGVLVMGFLMLFLMGYAAYMRAQSLYLSFKHESAIKLGQHFYYLVSEHEWNQVALARLRRDKDTLGDDGVDDAATEPCLMYTTRQGMREYWNGRTYAEHAAQAKFYPNKAAAELDHDNFRMVYPLEFKRTIHILAITEMDSDVVGKTRLLEIATAQFNQEKEKQA